MEINKPEWQKTKRSKNMNEEQKQQLTELELDEVVGGTQADKAWGIDMEGGQGAYKPF
jgi:hypothetical protein